MKIPFSPPTDGKRHRYCQNCYQETVEDIKVGGKTQYKCSHCGNVHDRVIDINPSRVWWIDQKTKEYWHESVGIFVTHPHKKILLMERTIYPYGHTIPAGHLDINEVPEKAAIRELYEETGIRLDSLYLFSDEELESDKCRGGADYHRWHLFTGQIKEEQKIEIDPGEGKNPVWLTLEEALTKELTFPTKYFIDKYGEKLLR
jgi:ADP-ribose pyrophosphatase YjhB (NUDIX family)